MCATCGATVGDSGAIVEVALCGGGGDVIRFCTEHEASVESIVTFGEAVSTEETVDNKTGVITARLETGAWVCGIHLMKNTLSYHDQ